VSLCVLSLPDLVGVLVVVCLFACFWFPFVVRGLWFGDVSVRGI